MSIESVTSIPILQSDVIIVKTEMKIKHESISQQEQEVEIWVILKNVKQRVDIHCLISLLIMRFLLFLSLQTVCQASVNYS